MKNNELTVLDYNILQVKESIYCSCKNTEWNCGAKSCRGMKLIFKGSKIGTPIITVREIKEKNDYKKTD